MDQSTIEVRLAHWKAVVQQCQSRPEGQTILQWLTEQGISESQYFYWQRRVRREVYQEIQESNLPAAQTAVDEVTFTEVPVMSSVSPTGSAKPDAVVKVGSVTIELSNTVSSQLLAGIMEAIRYAR